jgi:preprotein translocase subunit YajC
MLFIILQASGATGSMLMMLAMIAITYFFFLRPQITKQKQQSSFQDSIKKGDEVVTSSGIIGHISKIDDHEVTLQVDPKTFLRVTKGAISKELTENFQKISKGSTPAS